MRQFRGPATSSGGRSKRRARSGVSPIIATILLVAIVVVLAAVLYVIVANLAGGTSAAVPIGTALEVGPAKLARGTSSTNSYCQNSHYCYNVPVGEAGSVVTLGRLNFQVLTASGADWKVTKNYARISVVSVEGAVLASVQLNKNSAFAATGWTSYAKGITAATPLDSTMTVIVQFGLTSSSPAGQGLDLVVIGSNGLSGSTSTPLP